MTSPESNRSLTSHVGLFGPSGVRGIVDQDIAIDLCHDAAWTIATILPINSNVYLTTDPKESRMVVKEAVSSGLCLFGNHVTEFGILPQPESCDVESQ